MSDSIAKQLQKLCKADEAERKFKLTAAICFIPQVLEEEYKVEAFTLELKFTPITPTVTFEEKPLRNICINNNKIRSFTVGHRRVHKMEQEPTNKLKGDHVTARSSNSR